MAWQLTSCLAGDVTLCLKVSVVVFAATLCGTQLSTIVLATGQTALAVSKCVGGVEDSAQ